MNFQVLLTFYGNFYRATIAITFFECILLSQAGNPLFVLTLFWTKLASNVLIGFSFHFFKGTRLYFFFNLGYSSTQLYLRVIILDLVLWALSMGVIYLLI